MWTRVHEAIESLMASGKLTAHPTYFECVTAMAFLVFAEERSGFAIYEVGLGGRLDSTNIVTPEVAIITPIDFDHENFLGHSIEQIAGEKAGIIKTGGTIVSSAVRPEARAVVARRCEEVGARLVDIDDAWRLEQVVSAGGFYRAVATSTTKDSHSRLALAPALAGRFQLRNALAAATAARLLAERGMRIPDSAIEGGIAKVQWPGRLEKLSEKPEVFLDGTHNPAGARELLKFWEENFAGRKIILVYGAMRDKAVDEIAGVLFPRADAVILTEPRQPRAISAPLLSEMTGHHARQVTIERDPSQALERAMEMAQGDDVIFVTGSLYLIGDIRSYWEERIFTTVRPPS